METTLDSTTHLLTPQRVDQLIREHLDPRDYPAFPADLIAAYETCTDQADELAVRGRELIAAGLNPIEQPSAPEVRAHLARVEDLDARTRELEAAITTRLAARTDAIEQLYRALPAVAAQRQSADTARYLGSQQWLLHVQAAVTDVRRSDQRASILAVAAALAAHARTDGVFLAGVVDVQAAAGIAHSTWTRAYHWLCDHGLARTLHAARPLTLLERALAVGSDKHAHVRRWRAVIQLEHAPARVCRPTKWVPPSRRLGKALHPPFKDTSTAVPAVDSGASRRMAAPSSRPAPKKTARRPFRRFDPLAQVLLKRLQLVSETFKGVKACSVLPHLQKLAHADVEPAAVLAAIADLHVREGLRPGAASLDATRRAVWALSRIELDDVRMLGAG